MWSYEIHLVQKESEKCRIFLVKHRIDIRNMPESSAVYQPTTVGYAYDNGPRVPGGIRGSFSRIFSRHKLSSRKWLEWVLISVSFCVFAAGLTVMIVNLISDEDSTRNKSQAGDKKPAPSKDTGTEVEEHVGSSSSSSIAVGATLMLLGLFLGVVWVWLRFFRPSKSPRGGMTGGGGQMLGGLNPSTDLLVGSTSQYGPVLTELPSQMKLKSSDARETPVTLPLSDQEEETHTLMEAPSSPPTALSGSNAASSQIPGWVSRSRLNIKYEKYKKLLFFISREKGPGCRHFRGSQAASLT